MPPSGACASGGPGGADVTRAVPSTQTPRDVGRLPALDGVRGLAALVVVIYHASLIARPFVDGDLSRWLWTAVTESPLKLPFAGTEAVQVFFVLSGVVVTLPALREGFSWPGYYVSRVLRLYLPVWAAIVLSMLLITLVPRDPAKVSEGSWVVDTNQLTTDWWAAARDATLVVKGYPTINALWSLRWELAFSVLLPIFVVIALALRRHVWLAAAGCAAIMVAARLADDGEDLVEPAIYLPAFLLGCLIAVRLPQLREWSAQRRRPLLWAGVTAASATVLIGSWLGRPIFPQDSTGFRILLGLAAVGAAGLIVVAIGSRTAERLLQAGWARWLGAISFSLYLVHIPVLVTLTFAWGDAAWPLVALVGIPLSLVVGWVFLRLVERPAHTLARAAGRKARALTSP